MSNLETLLYRADLFNLMSVELDTLPIEHPANSPNGVQRQTAQKLII